ncbi:hypothetical protein SLOPH_1015 [Spraguea lophii 42_110]|uniref:Uncharacterized protein n=1 Tax=Spraguea lophii (strain 42_110) TaxID=1358809 RepID=S7W7L4_SPRLO|nr:hypothetical protein SLOPH_1015 [Spraguea lophii 42_110]
MIVTLMLVIIQIKSSTPSLTVGNHEVSQFDESTQSRQFRYIRKKTFVISKNLQISRYALHRTYIKNPGSTICDLEEMVDSILEDKDHSKNSTENNRANNDDFDKPEEKQKETNIQQMPFDLWSCEWEIIKYKKVDDTDIYQVGSYNILNIFKEYVLKNYQIKYGFPLEIVCSNDNPNNYIVKKSKIFNNIMKLINIVSKHLQQVIIIFYGSKKGQQHQDIFKNFKKSFFDYQNAYLQNAYTIEDEITKINELFILLKKIDIVTNIMFFYKVQPQIYQYNLDLNYVIKDINSRIIMLIEYIGMITKSSNIINIDIKQVVDNLTRINSEVEIKYSKFKLLFCDKNKLHNSVIFYLNLLIEPNEHEFFDFTIFKTMAHYINKLLFFFEKINTKNYEINNIILKINESIREILEILTMNFLYQPITEGKVSKNILLPLLDIETSIDILFDIIQYFMYIPKYNITRNILIYIEIIYRKIEFLKEYKLHEINNDIKNEIEKIYIVISEMDIYFKKIEDFIATLNHVLNNEQLESLHTIAISLKIFLSKNLFGYYPLNIS